MENMERFAPLYAIAYAILNSMENLRFDKEGYFQVFYGLFYKRNRKHSHKLLQCCHGCWKQGKFVLIEQTRSLLLTCLFQVIIAIMTEQCCNNVVTTLLSTLLSWLNNIVDNIVIMTEQHCYHG